MKKSVYARYKEAGVKTPISVYTYCNHMFPGLRPEDLTEWALADLLRAVVWSEKKLSEDGRWQKKRIKDKLVEYRKEYPLTSQTLPAAVERPADPPAPAPSAEKGFMCPYLRQKALGDAEEIRRLRIRVEQLSRENAALLADVRKASELQELLKKFVGGK